MIGETKLQIEASALARRLEALSAAVLAEGDNKVAVAEALYAAECVYRVADLFGCPAAQAATARCHAEADRVAATVDPRSRGRVMWHPTPPDLIGLDLLALALAVEQAAPQSLQRLNYMRAAADLYGAAYTACLIRGPHEKSRDAWAASERCRTAVDSGELTTVH